MGEFLQWCMEAGVAMATAFAFSTENWKRDAHEVRGCLPSLRSHDFTIWYRYELVSNLS